MRQKNVLEYLERTVLRLPQKMAFADEENAVTFEQIYDYSRRIGTVLAEKGYHREPIAVLLGHTVEAIVSFFGCIQAGCWYVPLDEAMGIDRIRSILDIVKPKVMICAPKTRLDVDFHGEIMDYGALLRHEINDSLLAQIRTLQIDTDPIYAVFTSGSTGTPKGVIANHRSVIDYIEALSEVLNLNEWTVFGNQSPLYFDACLKELYPTLKFGATTYLIPRHLFSFPVRLMEYLNDHNVNTICWVSSVLTMISAMNTFVEISPKFLHTVAFGSEVLPIRHLRSWRKALPNARFYNLYGPTECTGMSCYHCVTDEEEPIPIGRPFPNTRVCLLNEENQPSQEGEICISGTCLTMGYYADPNKTQEVFVQNPRNPSYSELIYRTGDLARYNSRGELVFLGRKDHQIKRMGHRIELGEIEAIAAGFPHVELACCIHHENKLVLYYSGTGDIAPTLRQRLPRHMYPDRIIRLTEMPLTINGKLNRQELQRRLEE